MTLNSAELRDIVHYDPETGAFTWLSNGRHRRAGEVAGRYLRGSYRSINIKNTPYLAHRLAWLYMTGEWPEADIDHRDRDPSNDRFDNLRASTRSQNLGNRSINRNNVSGYKGVSLVRDCKYPWRAIIKCRGKKYNLGLFADPAEAGRAYMKAAVRLFGEFATDGRS